MDTNLTPATRLAQIINGFRLSQAVYVAAKLGVADFLADGPRSSADLAQATGTHRESLFRLLRLLACVGIFAEVEPDRFALTPDADLLRHDGPGSMWRNAISLGEIEYPMWGELLYSVQTGGAAFDRAFGTSVWSYMSQHPAANALFNARMTDFSRGQIRAIVATYEFPDGGTIVDLGGGQGALLAAILRVHPGARGVLFDLPHVVASAPTLLEAEGVAKRCDVVAGDVFSAVPEGGDVYVMKWMLENWEDGPAIKLLTVVRRAMGAPGKLVLFDLVMPTELASRSDALLFITRFDVNMMVYQRGRIRTAKEYEQVLNASGFRPGRVLPINAQLSAIEGVPV